MSGDVDRTAAAASRREAAPAKLNLFLHVGAPAPDGYHPLQSLVVFAAFGDSLELTPADAFALQRSGPFADQLPVGAPEDLTARAVAGLAEIFEREPKFTLALEKNIPVAAGLGGGSADAAAAIRLVCREWAVSHDGPEVRALAERLGADVPMCLHSRSAWVAGVGERVAPLAQMPALDLLLINPRRPLSTADVFGAFTPASVLDEGDGKPSGFATTAAVLSFLAERRNDLTDAARTLCPPIADVLDVLERQTGCGLARMSGSGTTCFAIFDDEDACASAGRAIAAQHSDWWVQATKTREPAAPNAN